jgi:DNA-binding NtrC family response regulator
MAEGCFQVDRQLLLIIDDQVYFSAFLREKFEELGYSVLTAEDAFAALELVSQFEEPLVVLLDLMLPQVNGHQLLRELAIGVHASTIRVVLVSAHHTVETVAANHPMVVGRVQKPVDLGELTRIVNIASHDLAHQARSREDVL